MLVCLLLLTSCHKDAVAPDLATELTGSWTVTNVTLKGGNGYDVSRDPYNATGLSISRTNANTVNATVNYSFLGSRHYADFSQLLVAGSDTVTTGPGRSVNLRGAAVSGFGMSGPNMATINIMTITYMLTATQEITVRAVHN